MESIELIGGPSRARTGDQRIKSRFEPPNGVLSGPELSNSTGICVSGGGHRNGVNCTVSAPWIRRLCGVIGGLLIASCASALPRWQERCLALPGQTLSLDAAASELPSARAECLLALEPAGGGMYRVLGAWIGGGSAVSVPDAEKPLLAGAVTLHNHPAMIQEFSRGDLMMAVKYGAPKMCLAWRTGLGGALSRQHVRCITQQEALAALMERVPLEELRAQVAERASR